MKFVILDRDGVINHESRDYIKSPEEWVPLPGSLEAIAKFTQANYKIFVTTNQSAVARGYINLDTLEAIHAKMHKAVADLGGKIDKIYFCPHGPNDNCKCRKPLTGMFDQLAQDHKVNLSELNPPYIGDSLRDLQVAKASGCKFYLTIGAGGDGHETFSKLSEEQKQDITVVENLNAAAKLILS